MATRFYPDPINAASVSPAYDSGWDKTSGAIRKKCALGTKGNNGSINWTDIETSGTSGYRVLLWQFITEQLDSHSSASEDVNFAFRCMETDNKANFKLSVVVRKCDSDGSNPTTIGTITDTTEMPLNTYTDRHENASQTMSLSQGQRLIFEVGYQADNTKTDSYTGGISATDNHATNDLPADDAETAAYNSWVEIAGTYTEASGGITFSVGLPSAAGAALPTSQLFDYVFSVGIPSGVGAPLATTQIGNAVVVVGLPSGLGEPLSVTAITGALVSAGIPSGVGEAIAVALVTGATVQAGIPSGLGEAISVTVSVGGDEIVVVGIPSGVGAPLAVVATGAALVSAGLPTAIAEAIAVAVTGGANVSVGLPAGAGEALPTTQLYDYVVSVGIPAGAGAVMPVTVYVDGGPAFTFYISQIVPLEE